MSQLPEPLSGHNGAPPAEAAPAGAAPAKAVSARLVIGVVAGAATATLGGFILGEYPFTGLTPYIAGILFALVLAEVFLSVSRQHDRVTAIAAAACAAGGLGIAVWISTGEGIDPIPIGGWIAVLIGLVVGLARGGITEAGRREPNSPPSS